MSIKAEQAWELSCIIVYLDGTTLELHEKPTEIPRFLHGAIKEGDMELTLEEACLLRDSLTSAINTYKVYDEGLDELNEKDLDM